MDDYIKRGYAKTAICSSCANPCSLVEKANSPCVTVIELARIPSADVAPVRHGHWIIKCVRQYELSYGGTAYVPEYECSWCGFTTESYVRLDEPIMPEDADFPKYCEYCGAKMDEGEDNEL